MLLFFPLIQAFQYLVAVVEQSFLQVTQPARPSMTLSTAADLFRSKSQLMPVNALLYRNSTPERPPS